MEFLCLNMLKNSHIKTELSINAMTSYRQRGRAERRCMVWCGERREEKHADGWSDRRGCGGQRES